MTILILGPNQSGKSAYAEEIALRWATGTLHYIATMIPYGVEGQARVDKHREQRSGHNFITVEKPDHVSGLEFPPGATVLLEDISNLLGNAMFTGKGGGNADTVFEDITALCKKCENAVLVSIDGLTPEKDYDEETREYIRALNRLNKRVAHHSDAAVAMSGGRPRALKGDANALT